MVAWIKAHSTSPLTLTLSREGRGDNICASRGITYWIPGCAEDDGSCGEGYFAFESNFNAALIASFNGKSAAKSLQAAAASFSL